MNAPALAADPALIRAVVATALDAIADAVGAESEAVEDTLRVALDHFACRIGRIKTDRAEAARDRARRQTALSISRFFEGAAA